MFTPQIPDAVKSEGPLGGPSQRRSTPEDGNASVLRQAGFRQEELIWTSETQKYTVRNRHYSYATAEANIADGKGTIYDTANYIRNQADALGTDAALVRARQIGARGRKGATIALNSAPDLHTSFINEQISPDAAAAVAEAK